VKAICNVSCDSRVKEDKRSIAHGAALNFVGYIIKLGHPILLAICTRLYDASHWGTFVTTQAALMITTRVCLMGFDKGLLWWVSRQQGEGERAGIRPALWLVGICSGSAVLVITTLIASIVGNQNGYAGMEDSIRIMAFGIIPFALMEILIHSTMGTQRMEVNIAVKETLVPLSLVGFAALYFVFGFRETGLAVAFVSSNLIGLIASVFGFRVVFKKSAWPSKESYWPKRELVRYSLPSGGSEIANTILQRMDILVLSLFATPEIVGVYGVVTMFGNAIRSIRRSFDPIITSVISCIGSSTDPISSRKRIASSFSYAWFLVTATQLPIFAFLLCFANMLLTFYGSGFAQGTDALLILCGFWALNGAGSLAGLVVTGLGRSDLGLFNVLSAIAGQMVSLVIFVSPSGLNMGMEGAAISAGLGYTLQNALQHAQMKKITGMWNYTRQVLPAIFAGIAGFTVLGGVFFTSQSLGNFTARVVSFLAFLVVYGASLLFFWNADIKHQAGGGWS
jgi:O-antigen/teichoic acid export membrane protein